MQDKSEFNSRSHTPSRASHMREAILTVYGFTAGGSGMASLKAITVNAARTQIMHDRDFIAAGTECLITIIMDFQCYNSAK